MNKEDLKYHQFEFEKNRKNLAKELKPITQLRDSFVKYYTSERIGKLALDEYVVGKQSKSSFCYRIETELNDYGNIHGSPSVKFGIWFGEFGKGSGREYRIGKKAFGSTVDEAFARIKEEIQKLLSFKQDDSLKELKANLISPMFKGKILSLYFPKQFLNIYSKNHLDHFINGLKLLNTSRNELDKQALLMNYKNADPVMKNWSTHEFGRFLYMTFNTPNNDVKEKDISKELKGYIAKELPSIESVKPQAVETQLGEIPPNKGKANRKKTKVDFEKKNRNAKKLGDRGELIVKMYEVENLSKMGKLELANKVKLVSLEDDSAGYDILSYFPDGSEKHIEVKSTQRGIGYSSFFISSNEYRDPSSRLVNRVNITDKKGINIKNALLIKGDKESIKMSAPKFNDALVFRDDKENIEGIFHCCFETNVIQNEKRILMNTNNVQMKKLDLAIRSSR